MNNSNKLSEIFNKILIVAEMSANHNQSFEIALKTIKAAKESGADAIKLQTYTPDTMTIDSDKEYFRLKQGTIWDGRTLFTLYQEAYTPWEWHPKLKEYAEELGLLFFSTPFNKDAVDFLEKLNVKLYKIASLEITDIPLIEYTASKNKPIIISTGIAELNDIEDAIKACQNVGNNQIALLKCTSSYPAPIERANLKMIPDLSKRFGLISGLSDHTIGDNVAIAAAALGAKIIEKHFIIDRNIGGPDSTFSMQPEEFKKMVFSIREVEKALGKIDYSLSENDKKNRFLSRSLFVVKDIKEGEEFTPNNIRSIRPGYGLPPKFFYEIIGKKAACDISFGEPLKWEHIKKDRNEKR